MGRKLQYDYQLWIDGDIVFDTNKFWQLCDSNAEDGTEKIVELVLYRRWTHISVAHWLEEDDFRKNGGVMNHETLDSIAKRKNPLQLTTGLDGC